jgi:hypothetical protein
MPLGIFRKRTKTRLPDGTKKVIVTDRKGVVRKQKLVKPSGIKEKQKYNKAGDLHTAKLKGPGMRKKKFSGAKGSTIAELKTPGYEWAPNPNKKKALKTDGKTTKQGIDTKVDTKKTDTKKVDTKTNKVETKKVVKKTTPKKSQTFKEAFRENRDAGKKEFTWNNKKYHTKTKEEMDALKKKESKPKKDNVNKTDPNKVTDDISKGKKSNKAEHSKSQINRDKKFNNKYMQRGGQVRQRGGRVMGVGQWAGKSVPGMTYD